MDTNLNGIILDNKVYVPDKNLNGDCEKCHLKDLCNIFEYRTDMPLCFAFGRCDTDGNLCFQYSPELTDRLKGK